MRALSLEHFEEQQNSNGMQIFVDSESDRDSDSDSDSRRYVNNYSESGINPNFNILKISSLNT